MPTTRRSARDLVAARTLFSTATATVGGLYLATHSVAVTVIGTTASTALTCWAMWLPYKRNRALASREQAIPDTEAVINNVPSRKATYDNGTLTHPGHTGAV